MSLTLKSRIVSALGLVAMLTLPAEARSADAPLPKASLAPTGQSEVMPRRGPRLLSRREIFQAIQNDLAQKGISGRGELRPEDLRIQSSLPVLNDPMGLKSHASVMTPFGAKRYSNSGLPVSRSIFLLRSPRGAIRRVWESGADGTRSL